MSSSTDPPPAIGSAGSLYLKIPEGLPPYLADAIAHDAKGRVPNPYMTILYMDEFKFSYKDIHQILINKGLMNPNKKFTSEWESFYRRLTAEAAIWMTLKNMNYTPENLGRFFAQGQDNMDDIERCMKLEADDVKGLVSFNPAYS